MEKRRVLPGDVLATAEEYLAGDFAYTDDHRILSSVSGIACFDNEEMVVSIIPDSRLAVLKKDDIVYGEVASIGPKVITISLLHIEGTDRAPATEKDGSLQVSNMVKGQPPGPWSLFRQMELVRARVVQEKPSIQLTTASPELGTVKAYCKKCRTVLESRGDELNCPDCGSSEKRKTADCYGMPNQ